MRLGVVLAALLAGGPAFAGVTTSADGHRVRCDDGLEAEAATVARQVPVVRRQVAASLGFDALQEPAELVLVAGLERMRAEAGAAVPDWAGGVCVGARSRLVLRIDRIRASGEASTIATTLRHELVHLAWFRRAGERVRRLPLWVEEGLAEEIGGGITVDGGAQLDFAAAFDRLIPLDDLRTRWPAEAGQAGLAYRQGRSWVRYFVDHNGWDRLQRILRGLAEGEGVGTTLAAGAPFDELVFAHTGATLSHWVMRWRRHLEETADPWVQLLLRDFMGTIFLVIAVIAGLSFFVMRRRRRRQMSALPDDPHPLAEGAAGEA